MGWCPYCGSELATLLVDGRGYCREGHGWVWAEFRRPAPVEPEHDEEEEVEA